MLQSGLITCVIDAETWHGGHDPDEHKAIGLFI